MIKYTDLTLAYILSHAVCCTSAASSGRSLHLIIRQLRTMYSTSNCPNHVQKTKSSIKKRIIVRRTVRSIFGEQTVRPIKNGFHGGGVGGGGGGGQLKGIETFFEIAASTICKQFYMLCFLLFLLILFSCNRMFILNCYELYIYYISM